MQSFLEVVVQKLLRDHQLLDDEQGKKFWKKSGVHNTFHSFVQNSGETVSVVAWADSEICPPVWPYLIGREIDGV